MSVTRAAILTVALVVSSLCAACVSGTTPDCGPGSGCEPIVPVDASGDAGATDASPDAGAVDARSTDAPVG